MLACGSDSSGETVGVGLPVDPISIDNSLKPQTLPTYASLNLYNTNNPFNKLIGDNVEIDPNSSGYIQKLASASQGGDTFILTLKQYSATVFFADASTPKFNIKLLCGIDWEVGVSNLLQVPIPEFAEPAFDSDGSDNPIIAGRCGEDADQDNNMIIIDLENRCEYDFWQMRKEGNSWVCSWGNVISMDSDGIFAKGLSIRGSGFAFLGGVIWPDELANEEITHALAFNYPFTKSGGPVAPATESDGIVNDTNALPEGALLRLDPTLDVNTLALDKNAKTIAIALQKYGMYLVDNGGDTGIGFYLIDPKSAKTNPYADLLPNEDFPLINKIPLSKLQVLKLPNQNTDFQSNLEFVANDCADFN
jgi:hypothetical protein